MSVRKLPAVEKRVESGTVQFGEDWPGVFIRGDHALVRHLPAVARAADLMVAQAQDNEDATAMYYAGVLRGLASLLASCNAHLPENNNERQRQNNDDGTTAWRPVFGDKFFDDSTE